MGRAECRAYESAGHTFVAHSALSCCHNEFRRAMHSSVSY